MKKTTAILCATLSLFAACTKTALPEPPAQELPVEETTAQDEELKLNLTITRADGLGGDGEPGSKAIKTGWETGDVILVFFKTDVHKYLELKYDGARWTGTPQNGLTEGDITGASLKKLRAIHLPYGPHVSPEPSITSYNMLFYYDYFLESGIVDYTYSSTGGLTATLRMAAPEYTGIYAGKLIDFQVTGFDPSRTYHLNMKYLRKLHTDGILHSTLGLWYGAYGLDRERLIQGRKDGDAMHFTGLLDQSAVGTPVTFDFTILDQKNKIAYTRSVGPKTVNGNLSVDLGDISDATKWKATEYEDMGIDNEYGKRMYWARRNLGATADSGINSFGLFYAWGTTKGYPVKDIGGGIYETEHEISAPPFIAWVLDENNKLKPAYDAAYANLGGAWRIPTGDEWKRLWDNTKHPMTAESLSRQSRQVVSKISGYTDHGFYLPQPGYVYGTRLECNDAGHVWYWSSDYYTESYAISWTQRGTATAEHYSMYVGRGTPIRPVFTLQ